MRIGIVGGGPSGLMCALKAAENPDHRVFLIEKTRRPGRKSTLPGRADAM